MKVKPERAAEGALVQRVLGGEPEAFAELIDEYGEMIYTVSCQFLGDRAEAEDVVQEAFIQAYRKLRTFRGESAFSTWLFRIALNLCSNRRKRTSRVVVMAPAAVADLNQRRNGNPGNNPHNLLEVRDDVRGAMENLSLPLRRTLFLVAGRELSHREAAEIEGCSEGTISWRIFKARQHMRESLNGSREER